MSRSRCGTIHNICSDHKSTPKYIRDTWIARDSCFWKWPAFTSIECKTFLKENGIRHITTAPYHLAGNGLPERAVQTFKQALKKEPMDLDTKLSKFLFRYRMTPHATTGVSPAELLMQHKPHSRLDLLNPTVHLKQTNQKLNHDKSTPVREFK